MLKQPVINKNDIIDSLKKSGITQGDILFVHSSVGRFGYIKEVNNKIELANLMLESFLDVIGPTGTLIVPTFSYSFTVNEIFDVKNTPSTVGILSEVLRNKENAKRSIHPLFSVAAIGPKADYFTSNLDKTSFGKKSVFQKLLDMDIKYVLHGIDINSSCTFIHFIEQEFGVPYRYYKQFSGEIIADGKQYTDNYTFYVRYLDKNVITHLYPFQAYLEDKGAMIKIKLGNDYIRVISTKQLYDEGMKMLEKDVYYFLKTKPDNLEEI